MLTINNTIDGYLKDIEIKGNTIQDINQTGDLADIRSVGDKLENQELYEIPVLSTTTNLFDKNNYLNILEDYDYIISEYKCKKIKLKPNTNYCISAKSSSSVGLLLINNNSTVFTGGFVDFRSSEKLSKILTTDGNGFLYIGTRITDVNLLESLIDRDIQIEEGDVESPYSEHYEHKLTILSPKQLKSYNGTKDRIVCKNGVWVHEENVTYDAEGNGTILSKSIDTPLPHDQQISIRTFANKTNIHFGCEIEPTLKASVPKSIGASVNTHAEQIDNLYDEIDKIKKLEESVTSEVVSESDFITVENTSNGYFEDVKLEGRTLVNLIDVSDWLTKETTITATDKTIVNSIYIESRTSKTIKAGDKLTLIPKLSFSRVSGSGQCYLRMNYTTVDNIDKMLLNFNEFDNSSHLITIPEDFKALKAIFVGVYPNTSAKFKNNGVVLLEGDHTDKDIPYFEGLKSVGQDVDEISVLSTNKEETKKEETKEDKKRILYYNDETQSWEKPVLREWDSIEKHSDGKYYYHKRSGEVVLNGSENWGDYGPSASNESSKCFYVSTSISRPLTGDYMCDRLSTGVYNADLSAINDITKVTNSLYFNTASNYSNYAYIRVELSKLTSQDAAGFKAWLQSKPTTVVYQLAEEKVYECVDLDLITYADETNFMVKSGVLSPKTTLKLKSGVGNVVSMLQRKVTMLEDLVNKLIQSK